MDHNVKEAWDLGYTGRGVVVTILDDGLERTHPDIAPNYVSDARASYDVNDRDDDPMPRYEYSDENRHGTRYRQIYCLIFHIRAYYFKQKIYCSRKHFKFLKTRFYLFILLPIASLLIGQ
uniref:Peptidase_S8 domain-containing protein n=1 Tax=Heterorhabditis bacteriophora TaxID=37862 RepID=A0A1I7WCK1_HETBA